MDRSAPWYYDANGQIQQAVNNGNGWEFPMAPVGEDGREVRLVEDPALIKARTIEMLGYDPDDRQVNQNGSREVQIRNPMTGQFETGVITADGLEMPIGLAEAQGKQVIQYMSDPKSIGGSPFSQIKEMHQEGAFSPMLMAAGVNAMGGANMFGTNPGALADGGASLSAVDGVSPTSVASHTVEANPWAGIDAAADDAFLGQYFNSVGAGATAGSGALGGVYGRLGDGVGADLAAGAAGDDAFLGQWMKSVGAGAPAGSGLLGNIYGAAKTATTATGLAKALTGMGVPESMAGTLAALGPAALGGLLGSGALGGGNQPAGSTTTTQDVPDWQRPYIQGLLGQAQQTFMQQQGNQAPSNLLNAGASQMQSTINGDFLNSNPYLDDTYNKAARSLTDQYQYATAPGVQKQFGHSQAFGGNPGYNEMMGVANRGLATGLADLGTGIYGQNYQQERGRQFSAGLTAPDYASSMNNQPWANLNAYAGIAGRPYGRTETAPYYNNPTSGLLGGAMTGAMIGKMWGQQ